MLGHQKEIVLLCRCPTKYMQCRVYGMRTDFIMLKNKHSSLIQWTIAFSKKQNRNYCYGKCQQYNPIANIESDALKAMQKLNIAKECYGKRGMQNLVRNCMTEIGGFLNNIIGICKTCESVN